MKKVSYVLLGLLLFTFLGNNAFAKTLTISEVQEEFNTLIGEITTSEFSSSVDSENNKLNVYIGSEKYLTFNYTNEYIEYDDRGSTITFESVDKNLGALIFVTELTQSIMNLSGYEEYSLDIGDDVDLSTLFNNYGIAAETEEYELNDGNSTSSGDYLRYFKISLNTEKIDTLVAKYGVKAQEPVISKITITASDIKENSVILFPKMEFTTEVDDNYVEKCYIYRSESENGTFEKISNILVDCSGKVGLEDKNLASGVSYYYKATNEDGSVSSDAIKVTTKATSIDKKPVNTGMFFPVMGITFWAIGGIILYTKSKKRSLFNRI